MPKMKTHKGASKRIRRTKTGKLMARTMGQDHFNARESGKTTKNKRSDKVISGHNARLHQLLPR